jgi:hypothetical protein
MLGAIRNGISSDDRYSSSHPKTHRAAVGFSFTLGCVKRAKECWNESRTINGSAPAAKTRKTRQLEPGASPLIVRMIGTGRIRPTRRFKIKPLLNGTIPGQADWTRLRPQRRAQRGNPDAGHCLTPSGVLDYIGLSVPQRWGRFFQNENISRFRVFHRQNAPRVILSPVPGRQLVATGGSIPPAALAHARCISMDPRELAPFETSPSDGVFFGLISSAPGILRDLKLVRSR